MVQARHTADTVPANACLFLLGEYAVLMHFTRPGDAKQCSVKAHRLSLTFAEQSTALLRIAVACDHCSDFLGRFRSKRFQTRAGCRRHATPAKLKALSPHSIETAKRSLEDVAYSKQYWQVELQCPQNTAVGSCPVNIAERLEDGMNSSAASACQQVVLLFPHAADDTIADELLEWFNTEVCKQNQGNAELSAKAHLCLPEHISKRERAQWHKMAEAHGLCSQSQGFGPERRLYITPCLTTSADDEVSSQAKQIWDWCQMEGGRMWTYSQGEVQSMLRPGSKMPIDMQQMITRRQHAKQLATCLQRGDAASALDMLTADESLLWIRDDDSGGYPLHIAVYHGLTRVVHHLLQVSSVLEQRDGRRDTPLMLARRCGHSHIEQQLLAAGAKDAPSFQPTPRLNPGSGMPYSSCPRTSTRNAYAHSSHRDLSSPRRPPPGLNRADAASSWAGPPGFKKQP